VNTTCRCATASSNSPRTHSAHSSARFFSQDGQKLRGSFFPDGKRIAFTGNEEGEGPRLFVQDLAGGDPKPVSPEGVAAFAGNKVSPDGAFLAAASDAGLALYPTAGGEPRASVPAAMATNPGARAIRRSA